MIRLLMFATAASALMACTPQDAPADTVPPADPAASNQPTLMEGEVPAPEGEISISGVTAGARVSSPLVVEGFVKSDWVFEGQFPARIEVDGKTIAEAPARHDLPADGSYPDPTKFRAELVFDVAADTPATLVLQEDMPQPVEPDSDVAGPARTLRVPLTLAPPAQ